MASPLADAGETRRSLPRLILFVAWLVLVVWLSSRHVYWRDEVRAFSLALSGADIPAMLRNIHGEGHPALWYLILRVGHDLFASPHVLQVAGTAIGIAAMAILAWRSPFRTVIVAPILFSLFGAFEYVVMARNYGLSMLVMFALAAMYPRVRNTLWLGVILAILCNTNVPACLLAAALLLFRFIELLTDRPTSRRDWLLFVGNAVLSLAGATLCLITVYPTANDLAAPSFASGLSVIGAFQTLLHSHYGFASLGMGAVLLQVACLGLIRKPAGFIAALAGLLILKLFFVLVFPSSYRHELLFLAFLITLYWMSLEGAGGRWPERTWMKSFELAGQYVFVAVLLVQTGLLYFPLRLEFRGMPYSRSAQAGQLVRRPELRNAILMADPDTMVEPMAYYAPGHPLWFLRVQRFGTVVPLTKARPVLTLDDILSDARRLNLQTGRPVVFLSKAELRTDRRQLFRAMYSDVTIVEPAAVERFNAATRKIASLRGAGSDEIYDVYVYPARPN